MHYKLSDDIREDIRSSMCGKESPTMQETIDNYVQLRDSLVAVPNYMALLDWASKTDGMRDYLISMFRHMANNCYQYPAHATNFTSPTDWN
eukprot:2110167-Karenia_brevis.AAC.1